MTEFERATRGREYKRALADIAGMLRLAEEARRAGKNGIAGRLRDAAEDAAAFVAWRHGKRAWEVEGDLGDMDGGNNG